MLRDWVSKPARVSSLRMRDALVARSSFDASGDVVSSAATVTSIGAVAAARTGAARDEPAKLARLGATAREIADRFPVPGLPEA